MPADALDLAIANADKSAIGFSPIGTLLQGLQQGIKSRQQLNLSNAFSGGLPKMADGAPDYSAVGNTYIQNGDPATGVSLANLGLQRQLFNSAMGSLQPQQGAAPQGQAAPQAPAGSYAQRTAGAESSGNPNAISTQPGSHATGLYQFQPGTWNDLMHRHPELGLTPQGITDPVQQQRAFPVFTQENAAALQGAGIQPTDANLRVAHLLGAQGATGFLTSMAQNPNAPAASMVGPAAVKANQSLFFQGGQPVSAQDFYGRVTQGFAGPQQGGQPSAGMGQQQASAQPLIMGQFTPQQAQSQAQALFQKGTALNLIRPGSGAGLIDQAKTLMDAAAKTFAPSRNVSDYMVGHNPGESMVDFNARNAGTAEDAKNDVTTFQKRYTTIQALGQQSYDGLQKVQLMKQLTLQPGFYSGPLNENVQTYNQFKSIFGSNPSSALPQEAFNKVANDLLQNQVKSMGQSGVGRVLQSEVNIMKQSIASLGITPQSNRALAEILSRVFQQSQDIAQIARNVPRQPGKMNTNLDTATSAYLKQHPLFTQQEIQNPTLLGAPDAPPQSANWSPQQKQQWAQSIGLKSGDPVRFNGQVFQVP